MAKTARSAGFQINLTKIPTSDLVALIFYRPNHELYHEKLG